MGKWEESLENKLHGMHYACHMTRSPHLRVEPAFPFFLRVLPEIFPLFLVIGSFEWDEGS